MGRKARALSLLPLYARPPSKKARKVKRDIVEKMDGVPFFQRKGIFRR